LHEKRREEGKGRDAKEREGKERKGKERKGKERKGKERKGKEKETRKRRKGKGEKGKQKRGEKGTSRSIEKQRFIPCISLLVHDWVPVPSFYWALFNFFFQFFNFLILFRGSGETRVRKSGILRQVTYPVSWMDRSQGFPFLVP